MGLSSKAGGKREPWDDNGLVKFRIAIPPHSMPQPAGYPSNSFPVAISLENGTPANLPKHGCNDGYSPATGGGIPDKERRQAPVVPQLGRKMGRDSAQAASAVFKRHQIQVSGVQLSWTGQRFPCPL